MKFGHTTFVLYAVNINPPFYADLFQRLTTSPSRHHSFTTTNVKLHACLVAYMYMYLRIQIQGTIPTSLHSRQTNCPESAFIHSPILTPIQPVVIRHIKSHIDT